jgi:nucleotide-binding universal stress UspA family protein/GNAT superfamily N-acetyltransferase
MSPSSRKLTVELRDGSRVILRPIQPDDKLLLVDAFERLSDDSRYRRFFSSIRELSPSHLAYLTEVDHHDHEAIIALDRSTGEALGVARYIRAAADREVAEAAVTVVDDWQGRGLGRALLQRLATRARREGVRRFTALVQADNVSVVGLLEGLGAGERSREGADINLLIELPKRGIGAQLARALRAAATGSLVAVDTVAHRVAEGARAPAGRPPPKLGRGMRTIVVGIDGSPAAEHALRAAVELAARLDADMHVVSAYRIPGRRQDAEAVLARARRAAHATGRRPVIHALREHPAEALIAAAEEHDADLIVVGGKGGTAAARFLLGSVADQVARHAPCSVLIVRMA